MMQKQESSFKKTWNILLPFLVYFVVHDLAQVLLAILMNVSLGMLSEGYRGYMTLHVQTVNAVLNVLAIIIGVAAIWPMARTELREAKEAGSLVLPVPEDRIKKVWKYAILAVFAVSLAMGTNILLLLAGFTGSSQTYSEVAARQYGVAFPAGLLIYGVFAPLAEEIVFRGLIYNRMKRYFPVAMSVIVCGILFGAYHGNLVQAVYGAILGIAITCCYEKYKDFAAPVLFHSLANLSVFTAGYHKQWMDAIATPVNCVIFMTISLAALVYILKMKKNYT